jgi:glycosyltransferase involved in cell wall biosynthesis
VTAPLLLSRSDPRTQRTGGFRPMRIIEAELCQPLPAVGPDRKYQRLWVLARLRGEPIGTCRVDLSTRGLSPENLGQVLWREFGDDIAERFAAAGLPAPHALGAGGLEADPKSWPFLQARSKALAQPPYISVVICTYNRPDRLAASLQYLRRQQYPAFEVVVVDNCPKTAAVREHLAGLRDPRYRYVAEPRAGLSRARNAGISAAVGDVVAFLDDDEEPDDLWLAAIARGFSRCSDVGCVTGPILPACLDTEAQVLFEDLGGHVKDRGFEPAIFSGHGPQSPLYPRPPFGAGGNMAFRRQTLARIGRFDTALGAGTPALGAEDTLALALVLLSGQKIAYEPAAFVRHHDHRRLTGLARQLRGYTVSLTAYYTALLCRRPWVLVSVVRLLPDAVGFLTAAQSLAASPLLGLMPELASARTRGLLAGPAAYLRGVVRNVAFSAQQAWGTSRWPCRRRRDPGA